MSITRVFENLQKINASIISASYGTREPPTLELVRGWHRDMCDGIIIPDDAYRGGFRGDPHPALTDYENHVGTFLTVPASEVATALGDLLAELAARIVDLDTMDLNQEDFLSAEFVEKALETAAWLHGEWIRIHPHVNGNGRTARMWVLWVCARYGLPQLLPLRPRPDLGYGPATMLSMAGDHSLFQRYLLARYNQTEG